MRLIARISGGARTFTMDDDRLLRCANSKSKLRIKGYLKVILLPHSPLLLLMFSFISSVVETMLLRGVCRLTIFKTYTCACVFYYYYYYKIVD